MNHKLFAGLLIIILISGCIGGGGTTGVSSTEGIRINSFGFEPKLLTTGEIGQLSLEIENVGGITANNVVAELHNIDFSDWNPSPSSLTTTDITMYPPDPDRNVVGDKSSYIWDLEAPTVPEGIKATYNPRVRVCYDYQTTATTSFLALTSEQWRIEQQQGSTQQTNIVTQNSGGPIHFEIDARAPVIIYGGTPILRLNVKAVNANPSQGLAYQNTATDCMDLDNINTLTVTVTANGQSDTQDITLINGRDGSKVFELDLSSGITRQEISVIIESTYGYFIESETSMEARSQFV